MYVTGVQHYSSTSVYTTKCSPPQVWIPSITVLLAPFIHFITTHPLPHAPSPLVTTDLFSAGMSLDFFFPFVPFFVKILHFSQII